MTTFPEATGLATVGFLREEIHRTALPARRKAPARARRRSLIAALISALTAIPAAVVILVASSSATPGYGVARQPDGRVTVTLNLATSISALNAKMRAMGLAVRAVPALAGCEAPARTVARDRLTAGPARTLMFPRDAGGADRRPRSLTISAPTTRAQTLVLAAGSAGLYPRSQMVLGPAPACVGLTG